MDENTYRTMTSTGRASLVFGILSIVLGTTVGVLLIVNGAKLLSGRKKITI